MSSSGASSPLSAGSGRNWRCSINGGTRDAVEAKHLKQQGVKSGVPDLCLPVPRGQYHGLYIEMKTESGHTSDEQEWWGERLQAQGYVWRVCHGWQAAVAVLEWYLQL